jgi:ABC-type transport system involved in cytochrome c biogenesis ATPase subunit
MSCHTNEKPIDLPPSINLLTPMAPLIELDDLIRETSCEVDYDPDDDDNNNNDQQCGADYSSSSSNSENEVVTTGKRSLSSKVHIDPLRLDHVPKLSVTMPSTHVIEISQTFYWPLYSRPIDWIYQENVLESCETSEVQKRIRKVAEELHSLDFFQPVNLQLKNKMNVSRDGDDIDEAGEPQSPEELEEAAIVRIMNELEQEKEDWFSDLSGGQKSKVELVRLVFIQDQCPDVLLVDETMAPLDPASKSLVMKKLKDFCSQSIIIVIYHTDVQQHTITPSNKDISGGGGVNNGEDCVPSNDFFDQNLHLEHGLLHIRPTC